MEEKGILAVVVAGMATFFLGFSAVMGNTVAQRTLIAVLAVVLGGYFGLEGRLKGMETSITKEGFMEQKVLGVTVRAILALVVGIGVTFVLAWLSLAGSSMATSALIGYDNLVISYYFTSEAAKASS